MIISKKFQGKFFGDYVNDLFKNYGQVKIPDFVWDDGSPVLLIKYEDYNDVDRLRWFLKIFDTNFPKKQNGEPYSMRDIDSKIVCSHIDFMRTVLIENGSSFLSDDEEWKLLIEQYNR